MDRIIEVKVCGSHLTKDSNKAGTKGEANMTRLRIAFDENWEDFAKRVIFWDAYGQNPVKVVLGTNLIEDIQKSTRVYLVPIPAEAMARAGWLTFSIQGTLDNKNQVAITSKLEVADSPDILDPLEPTPSELEQIQGEIEAIKDDLKDLATAREESTENAKIAKESADKAESAVGKSSYIGDDGYWYVWDQQKGEFCNSGVKAQSGSTVYMGANPPDDADVWIENGETLYFRNADGVFVPLTVIHGKDGKSVYDLAVEGGYKGTEEQLKTLLNNLTASIEGSHLSDTNNPHNVTPEQIGAIPEAYHFSTDLNIELQQGGGKMTLCYYTSETLNTPKTEKVTDYAHGMVITNAYTEQYGTQLCIPSGDYNMYLRRKNKLGITGWKKVSHEDIETLQETVKKLVSKQGDTMTGPLVIDKDEAWGQLVLRTPSGYLRSFETDDDRVRIDVRDEQLTTRRRYLEIYTNNAESRHSHAMRFVRTADGISTAAYVLHTENIKDFVLGGGTYEGTGTNTANNGKQITIRPTTMAVIVDCIDDDSTECHTVLLVRGSKYCASPTAGQTLLLVWENDRVTIGSGYYNTLNELGKTYRYILIG